MLFTLFKPLGLLGLLDFYPLSISPLNIELSSTKFCLVFPLVRVSGVIMWPRISTRF